jgi:hypothetical protein
MQVGTGGLNFCYSNQDDVGRFMRGNMLEIFGAQMFKDVLTYLDMVLNIRHSNISYRPTYD